MKSVEAWIEMERKLTPDDDWEIIHQYHPNVSIEEARSILERTIPVLPETDHRLVYVRVETTREMLS